MNLGATLALLAVGAGMAGWAAWQERRERTLGDVPALPPVLILVVGVLIMLMAGAHLVTLVSGVPLRSRFVP